MFVHYRTQGIIFKKEERGEADQLFTIYTKDFGKLEILGKAIRKITSKLRSAAEIFYLSEIEFIQGKTHKTLTDAICLEKFPNLKKNLERLAIAFKISKVLDSLIKGEEPDEKTWYLLIETFQKLNTNNLKPKTYKLVYYYFLWNLLSLLGYKPQLYQCSLCQKKLIPGKLCFNPREGGIICSNCFKKIKSGREVNADIVKILRIILERDWKTLSKLKNEPKYLKDLASLSKNYLSLIWEENLLPS